MSEWILIIAMNIISQPGNIRDISPIVVSGFSTKEACIAAGGKISLSLISLSGKLREQQGVQSNTRNQSPALNFECIQANK